MQKEKNLVREIAEQKEKLENDLNESERLKQRLQLKLEDAQMRLKQKESHLVFIWKEYMSSVPFSKNKNKYDQETLNKIENAQKRKSKEEKDELIERLFLENLNLKKDLNQKTNN